MNSRRTPRWANLAWWSGALLMIAVLLINAYRHGYDFVQTVGYLGLNFGNAFAVLVLLGLILNGAVALVNVLHGRNQLQRSKPGTTPLTPAIRKRLGAMYLTSVAMYIPMAWLIFVRPLGNVVSIGLGIGVVVAGSLLISRIAKPLRTPEIEKLMTEWPDEYLKARDDLNEPARWVP